MLYLRKKPERRRGGSGMRVLANGIEQNYELVGPESGPVVALSHSLGSSRVMWDPQTTLLSQRYRVLRYDTRGHGLSDAPSGAYDLDTLAADAAGLLDALGIDRVHWVGLSMGGMIGQKMALNHRKRLASLTLCDTAARVAPEMRGVWDERIRAVEGEGMGAQVDTTMQRWFTEPYRQKNPPPLRTIRAEFLRTPPAGFVGCCHAIKLLDNLDRLHEIDLPTLILVGREDPSTPPAASEAMRERIRGATMTVIDDGAHLPNVEQPAAFNAALGPFLAQHA